MARTIVYGTPGSDDDQTITVARGPDGFASRVAKYVPAEMVSIAVLFFGVFKITGAAIWIYVAIGAVLNALYLWTVSRAAADTPNPRAWFYFLSALAFVLWSLAMIDAVAAEAGLSGDTSQGQRAFMLALTAFAIPALDTVLTAARKDRR